METKPASPMAVGLIGSRGKKGQINEERLKSMNADTTLYIGQVHAH